MKKIDYDSFLARIYDDSPSFGKVKINNLERMNAFYMEGARICEGPVLEFGTATGMLTIQLAREGYKVHSVDISPYMHQVVREKLEKEEKHVSDNITLILGDALEYKHSELYNMIAIPDGLFLAIADQEQQLTLLNNCNRNLNKGGRLYLDIFQPMERIIYDRQLSECTRFRTKNGELFLMTTNYTVDLYPQIQYCDFVYTKMNKGKAMEEFKVNIVYRYVYHSELELMLKHCGFKVVEIDTTYIDGRGFAVIAEKI